MATTSPEKLQLISNIESLGLKHRIDFTIKEDSYSMGCSYYVKMRSEKAFDLQAKIKAQAKKTESIDRDHATGEILSGGNVFIDVELANKEFPWYLARKKASIDAIVPVLKIIYQHNAETGQGETVSGIGTIFMDNRYITVYWDKDLYLRHATEFHVQEADKTAGYIADKSFELLK